HAPAQGESVLLGIDAGEQVFLEIEFRGIHVRDAHTALAALKGAAPVKLANIFDPSVIAAPGVIGPAPAEEVAKTAASPAAVKPAPAPKPVAVRAPVATAPEPVTFQAVAPVREQGDRPSRDAVRRF